MEDKSENIVQELRKITESLKSLDTTKKETKLIIDNNFKELIKIMKILESTNKPPQLNSEINKAIENFKKIKNGLELKV